MAVMKRTYIRPEADFMECQNDDMLCFSDTTVVPAYGDETENTDEEESIKTPLELGGGTNNADSKGNKHWNLDDEW